MHRVSAAGGPVDTHADVAHATLAVRWLVLALLVAHDVAAPGGPHTPAALFVGMAGYALVLALWAWRLPTQAVRAARVGIGLDVAAVAAGLLLAARAQGFLFLGFPVVAAAGVLTGYQGGVAAAAVVAGAAATAQRALPVPSAAGWAAAAVALVATALTAAAAGVRSGRRAALEAAVRVLSERATSPGPVQATAEAVLDEMSRLLGADSGSVMVYLDREDRLEILASRGLREGSADARPRLGEGIAGWVAREGRPILLTPGTSTPVPLTRQELGSSLCVPLTAGSRPLGVLNLNRMATRPWFTLEDLQTADLLARAAAPVLIRARAERELAAALVEVAAGIGDVTRALARDPSVLWPALLDQARSLTAAQFAVLALEREDTGMVEVVASRGIGGQAALGLLPGLLAASTQGQVHTLSAPPGSQEVAACVPLTVDGKTIGAVAFGLAADGPTAPDRLAAVSAQMAAAVQMVRTAHRIADIGIVEERRRIARELHDGVAQTLADALLQTDLVALTLSGGDRTATDLADLRGLLERAMRELREYMSDLRRQPDVGSELPAALEALGREFQRQTGIATAVETTGETSRLPSAVRHAILAIVRQALTNVRTHARATAVQIRARVDDDGCTASVTDNGIGFDVAAYRAQPPGRRHLGLVSMEERAALVGGRLDVESAPGRGTTVTVRVPLGR
ncbi:MAG: GAF domain-containing sensor histidine kinase [Armatimonadota bacterium]|nr:GAF domain-containing sensor histidine kinase [Armatimonadota bacterium]